MIDSDLEQLVRDLESIKGNYIHSLKCEGTRIEFTTHDLWQMATEAQKYRSGDCPTEWMHMPEGMK